MSRWIDADALEYDTEWSEYHDGFTAYSQMAIDTAPSIDIVRCKECKYWRTSYCSNMGGLMDAFGKKVNRDALLAAKSSADLWKNLIKATRHAVH